MYKDYLGEPLSHKAHELLHSYAFVDLSDVLGPNGACTPETCPQSVANLKKLADEGKL